MTFSCATAVSATGVSVATGPEASGVASDSSSGETAGSAAEFSAADGPEAPVVASRAVAGSEGGVSVEAGSGVVAGFVTGVSVTAGEVVAESAGGEVDWEAGVSAAAEEGGEASETGVSAAGVLDLEAGVLDLGVDLRTVLTTRLLGAIGTKGISRVPQGEGLVKTIKSGMEGRGGRGKITERVLDLLLKGFIAG